LSISSRFLSGITAFRNPNGSEEEWPAAANRNLADPERLFTAEFLYIATIPFAIVETALSTIAKLFSMCLPIDQRKHEKMSQWLSSSAFSIVWALADVAANIVCNDMVQTERVARACAASGNIFAVPIHVL